MNSTRLSKIWDSLHSSYWFVPTIMAVIAIALAFTMLTLDRQGYYGPFEKWGWIYTGGPDGARGLLSSVAGSIVSVTATAFSITIVALQLASSNYGPRLLRNFMQDTGNQFVLGTFIATFIYSLLVLRSVRGADDIEQFVPQISVTVGIFLALLSTGVLIYFIHHASTIIQASHIISEVSDDLDRAIKRLFPETIGRGLRDRQHQVAEIPLNFDTEACPIKATGKGYIQAIDEETLMKLACKHNLLLRIQSRPGKYVIPGSVLVMVWSEESANKMLSGASVHQKINNAFVLGRERTEQQDVEFLIQQLVEIALRAISPGINDPFTAIRCIDRLCDGLSRLAQKDFPSPYRFDDNNDLRVIAEPVTFAGLIDAAFNQIRQYSSKDVAVRIRLLEAIAQIATYTHNSKDQAALKRHAEMILRSSQAAFSEDEDCKDVQERYHRVIKALAQEVN